MNVLSDMGKTKEDTERGERIRTLNKQAGYSGSELASFLHYKGHSSVSKLFSGDIKPTSDVLKKLSQFFGVSADFILYGTADSSPRTIQAPKEIEPKPIKTPEEGTDAGMMKLMVESLIETTKAQNKLISDLNATIQKLINENSDLKNENNPRNFSNNKKTVNGDSPGE